MIHDAIDLPRIVAPTIKKAGALLLDWYNKPLVHKQKKDGGLVTQADLASEQLLISELSLIIEHASFFAEESGKKDTGSEYCWVIDPLDGTTNFANKIPYFCISVALTYHNKPVFGMIYNPLFDELFYAQAGKGAYLNEVRLHSNQTPLQESILAIRLFHERDSRYQSMVASLVNLSKQVYSIRSMGATAYDIALVAAGRYGAVVCTDLGWWDVAAGMIILQEAGGCTSEFDGRHVGPQYATFIGSGDEKKHKKLLELVKV